MSIEADGSMFWGLVKHVLHQVNDGSLLMMTLFGEPLTYFFALLAL